MKTRITSTRTGWATWKSSVDTFPRSTRRRSGAVISKPKRWLDWRRRRRGPPCPWGRWRWWKEDTGKAAAPFFNTPRIRYMSIKSTLEGAGNSCVKAQHVCSLWISWGFLKSLSIAQSVSPWLALWPLSPSPAAAAAAAAAALCWRSPGFPGLWNSSAEWGIVFHGKSSQSTTGSGPSQQIIDDDIAMLCLLL